MRRKAALPTAPDDVRQGVVVTQYYHRDNSLHGVAVNCNSLLRIYLPREVC